MYEPIDLPMDGPSPTTSLGDVADLVAQSYVIGVEKPIERCSSQGQNRS